MLLGDDDEKEATPGSIAQIAHEGDDSEDEFSGPTVGNSEGDSVAMTDEQVKQAKGLPSSFLFIIRKKNILFGIFEFPFSIIFLY